MKLECFGAVTLRGEAGARAAEGVAMFALPTQEKHDVCRSYVGEVAVNN